MNKNNILLTFVHVDGYLTFAWFEKKEDASLFAFTSKEVKSVIECFDCSNIKEVYL